MSSAKLEGLRSRRNPLFSQFENNPHLLHLALEIKIIDDQIARCNRKIQADKKNWGSNVEMASNVQSAAAATDLQRRVEERFGVLPNFFRLSPETPGITEKLWAFAQAAYLDNPLASIFKERLFVHLSRFCAVRYCIARHTGFLLGLGRPAGDRDAGAGCVAGVVKLLRRPLPRGPELQSRLAFCSHSSAPLIEIPAAETQMEDALFRLPPMSSCRAANAPPRNASMHWNDCWAPFGFNICCSCWHSFGQRTFTGPGSILKSSLRRTSKNFLPRMKCWLAAFSTIRKPLQTKPHN